MYTYVQYNPISKSIDISKVGQAINLYGCMDTTVIHFRFSREQYQFRALIVMNCAELEFYIRRHRDINKILQNNLMRKYTSKCYSGYFINDVVT